MERAGVLFVWRKERAGGSRVCTEVPGCGAEHAQRGREWRGERVGGQDGRGWTLARSLSKRRLKVYTYAVGGFWNTEVQGGPGNTQVGQRTPKGHGGAGGIGAGAAGARGNLPDGPGWGERSRQKEPASSGSR